MRERVTYCMVSTGFGSFGGQLKVRAMPNYQCFFLNLRKEKTSFRPGQDTRSNFSPPQYKIMNPM